MVPIKRWDRLSRRAVEYAIRVSPDVVALHLMVKACVAWDAIEIARGRQRNLCDEAMALAPKLADFPEEPIALATALDRLESQTGVHVDDRRQKTEELPPLRLKLHKATFWQCLDAIAREADLKVSLNQPESRIAEKLLLEPIPTGHPGRCSGPK